MANNRMFLVHTDSELGVMLGKELGNCWYKAPERSELERFYEYIYKNYGPATKDFILLMENEPDFKLTLREWSYGAKTVNGFKKFNLGELYCR